jgi:hypothetical protein
MQYIAELLGSFMALYQVLKLCMLGKNSENGGGECCRL